MNSFQRFVAALLCLTVLNLGSPTLARAEIIGTLAAVESQGRGTDLSAVTAALARDQVREQMLAMGVDPAGVEQRLAALTDSELRTLAQQIESMPAGGDALAVIGVIFLVLLILEVVGVIDIFKKGI